MKSGASTCLMATLVVAPLAFVATACGSSQDSALFGEGEQNPPPPPAEVFAEIGPQGTSSACVSSVADAALRPANLVFMYDKSGSMGDPADGFDPAKKWVPVGTGMKAFFSDPESKSINASLQFFPLGGDLAQTCNYAYESPTVAMQSLSNPTPFVSAIDATKPNGGTPTYPALQGALKYARTVADKHPGDATAVVLVTDGEPGFGVNGQFVEGCTNNNIPQISSIAEAAFKATPSVPTYVIGVGSSLTKLNAIASAGGTKQAFIISVNDPAQTKESFQQALTQVRAQSTTCDFALPQPPAGQELNIYAVNVVITSKGGQKILQYSKDCASGEGWHYDNLGSPSRIQLCQAACSSVRSDPTSKIEIAFGCKTSGNVR